MMMAGVTMMVLVTTQVDDFPDEPTQWKDSDGDGYRRQFLMEITLMRSQMI